MSESIQDTSGLTIEENILQYETRAETVQTRRQKLIAKMEAAVDKMDLEITNKSDPDLVMSQARVLEQYRQMLNDVEASERNLITTKLKKKDSETTSLQAGQLAEFLKSIKFSNGVPMEERPKMTAEELNKLMEKQFEERGCVVVETELEANDRQLPTKKVSEDEF